MNLNPDSKLQEQIQRNVEASFESEQLSWLEKIVNQPSHSMCREDVEAAASLIDSLAGQIGMRRECFPDDSSKHADTRVFSTPATQPTDQALALSGHCDTVYPRSQGFLEFRRGEENPDHVFGPGVLDMKSGLSVALFALRAVAQSAPDRFQTLKARFICNTDEEVGSPSSRLVFEKFAPLTTMALVFEGGRDEDKIITSRKGTGGFKIVATGQEAHAGNDHAKGVNAIHALSAVIPHIEALTNYDAGTTVNVGLMQGGTSRNTVPATAECHIDVRISQLDQMQIVEQGLQDIVTWKFPQAEQICERIRGANLDLTGGISRSPMETTAASEALRLRYESFAHPVGLGTGAAPMQGGGSDANNFSALGVPTIDGLGPYGKFMHSPREWCSLSSLRQRTIALAWFLADAATGHET